MPPADSGMAQQHCLPTARLHMPLLLQIANISMLAQLAGSKVLERLVLLQLGMC